MEPPRTSSCSRARVAPLASDDTRANDPLLEDLVRFAGYRPNALLTMARQPGLLPAVLGLVQATIQGPGSVEPALRFLVASETSRGAGCRYSLTHALHATHRLGVDWTKLEALPAWRNSPLYTPRERAALAIASAGATLPVASADAAFCEAREHFTEDEVLELTAIVALFGWFNRWNSLMSSELEDEPAHIQRHITWLASTPHASTTTA